MMLYKGLGLRAGHKPLSSYARRAGEQHGHFWFNPERQQDQRVPTCGRRCELLEDLHAYGPGHRRRRLGQPDDVWPGPRA